MITVIPFDDIEYEIASDDDGRYASLYWSNVSPYTRTHISVFDATMFLYDAESNHEIYAVAVVDRETAEIVWQGHNPMEPHFMKTHDAYKTHVLRPMGAIRIE